MLPISPPAQVEVDSQRRYIAVNDAACELLGYSRDELLNMRIDDISFPSGAHVDAVYERYLTKGTLEGVFALRRKNGEVIWVRYTSEVKDGRFTAIWTEYEPWETRRTSPVRAATASSPIQETQRGR